MVQQIILVHFNGLKTIKKFLKTLSTSLIYQMKQDCSIKTKKNISQINNKEKKNQHQNFPSYLHNQIKDLPKFDIRYHDNQSYKARKKMYTI